jgi:GntR family transcriptional regulator, transcriptional repressor for pyruvate dehydrogenase complex
MQVIDHLLALIRSGKVRPGERLPTEKELTEQLSVSRTCVREAIKSLEVLNLIQVRPRTGAIVLEPSPTALINAEHLTQSAYMQRTDALIEFRKLLELGLAALAAENATADDRANLQRILSDHERALTMDRSTPEREALFYKELGEVNLRFHTAIAEATKNPIAVLVLQVISKPLIQRSRQTNIMPGVAEAGLREHRKIYRAIEKRNAEKARTAMRFHIESAERNARLLSTDLAGVELGTVPIA